MGEDFEVLQGGIGNARAVVRVGAHVLRPTSAHTPAIHALLGFVRAQGFDGAPEVVGIDPDGRERLVFIPGEVPIPPFPGWSQADEVLASTATLLRRFHDATVGFAAPPDSIWSSELADPRADEAEVICHNDVCPENVVYRDRIAVALLDFEFAAPGRRTFDVASLARMCVPIEPGEAAAKTGRGGLDPFRRTRVVADAYRLGGTQRLELVDVLSQQLERGGDFVRRRVENGEPAFIEMWEANGGQGRYDRRRDWFEASRQRFVEALG